MNVSKKSGEKYAAKDESQITRGCLSCVVSLLAKIVGSRSLVNRKGPAANIETLKNSLTQVFGERTDYIRSERHIVAVIRDPIKRHARNATERNGVKH